jgi:hypothetical protein
MYTLQGHCHCGNLEVTLRTQVAPADAAVRACQCSFCRKHSSRTISDPQGEAEIRALEPELLQRYRFGLKTAEFFICRRCGIYVGAVMMDAGQAFAVLDINSFDHPEEFVLPPEPADFDGEVVDGRVQRRRARWTPAKVLLGERV